MTDIEDLEERVRAVEIAIVELSLISKYMRVLLLIVGAGLGIDVTGMI